MSKCLRLALLFSLFPALACGQTSVVRTIPMVRQAFEPNRGQADRSVDFISHGPGYAVSLSSGSAALQLVSPGREGRSAGIRLNLVGSHLNAHGEAVERQAGTSNYLLGNDPGLWQTDVPQYGRVEYHGVYPGIDIAYYGNNERLEYDFILAPDADPGRIRLAIEGADQVRIDDAGDLVLTVGATEIRERRPDIYQETAGGRRVVEGHYVALGSSQVGFELEKYDRSKPLIIDPVLVFSTFFGSTGNDGGGSVILDSNGNIYFSGVAGPMATSLGSKIGTPTGVTSYAYVAKASPAGALLFSTFIGGSGDSALASAIALDANGNIYVEGSTASSSFPVLNAIQKTYGGAGDIFVLELTPAGNSLVWSTYIGGSALDAPGQLAVDLSGNILVSGWTQSRNFPVNNATQPTLAGPANAVALKISAGGASLVFSTYYGGSGSDYNTGMTLDASGDLIFFGTTNSSNFPVLNAYQSHYCGWVSGPTINTHGYVTALNLSGTPLYSTYICGSDAADEVRGAAVDNSGNLILIGFTGSATFPVLNAVQSTYGGETDTFVMKFSPTNTLLFSTYLGGSGNDIGRAVTTDQLGNIYVTGNTGSTNFPTVNPIQNKNAGADDAFLTKINAAGTAIVFSTYLGGTGEDYAYGVAVDSSYNAYLSGSTASTNFPTASAEQPTYGGGPSDAFLAEISTCVFTLSSQPTVSIAGGTGSVTITTIPSCGWTATTSTPWITITSSPASGTGSGSIAYSVAANNTAGPRQGSLTIDGQAVTISQYAPPVLTLTQTNSAPFTQGQNGATYTVVASSSATGGPTAGAVTLAETLPTGLTLVSMSGSGWNCTGASCTRSDSLAEGASYPTVTVSVNVALNAGSPLAAQATFSGGGALTPVTATDSTTILLSGQPVLSVTQTNSAPFTQGATGATYTITVRNGTSGGATSGMVTAAETLPTGLTLVSMAGAGWSCSGTTCNRNDALAPGASWTLTVTVNVASNAGSPLTAGVTVSGGGAPSSVTASDVTTINTVTPPAFSITEGQNGNFAQGENGATYTATVSNGVSGGPTSGTVTVTEALPNGLTLVSMSGSGWNCSGASCTRGDVLSPGASYPALTVTVNVSSMAGSPLPALVSVSGGRAPSQVTVTDSTTVLPVTVLTLTNQGANALTYGGIEVVGTSATQTNNCPNILGVGVTCTMTLTFAGAQTEIIISEDWPSFSMYAASDQLIVQNPPVSPALVFTGDSITQFWDSPSPYGEGSLQAVQPFINRGISGQTTEQMLVRFQEDVIKLKPALVHIFGGINDLGGNTGPETLPEIMDQIASMTRLAQSYGIKVLIASVTPTVDTPGNPWSLRRPNSSIVALDQLIQAYCQQSGAVYVDYFDVLVDPKTGAMNVNLTVDGLHPNTQGFALMVPVAQAAIQQALGN